MKHYNYIEGYSKEKSGFKFIGWLVIFIIVLLFYVWVRSLSFVSMQRVVNYRKMCDILTMENDRLRVELSRRLLFTNIFKKIRVDEETDSLHED